MPPPNWPKWSFSGPPGPQTKFWPLWAHGDPPLPIFGVPNPFLQLVSHGSSILYLKCWGNVPAPPPPPTKGSSAPRGDDTGDRYPRPPALEGNFRDAPWPPMSAVEREGVIGLNGKGGNQKTTPHARHMPGTRHTPLLGYKFSNLLYIQNDAIHIPMCIIFNSPIDHAGGSCLVQGWHTGCVKS